MGKESGLRLATASPEETHSLGQALAGLLRPGDVVSLTGDLGAGKTNLVQGAARGLGVTEPVLSPTFTLIRQYQGSVPIYHLDVYRLDRIQDVLDLGFDELVDQEGIVFVEWGDAIDALLPTEHLQVELTIRDEGSGRSLRVTWAGPSWSARAEGLAAVLAPWGA
jgi:tRNA threonylcarbamoyladenosine biosynthesis protein TsaE